MTAVLDNLSLVRVIFHFTDPNADGNNQPFSPRPIDWPVVSRSAVGQGTRNYTKTNADGKDMKKLSPKVVAVVAVLALIVGLSGCCCIVKSCLRQVLIVGEPQSLVYLTNVDATFRVYAVVGPPYTNSGLTYQ